MTWRDRRVAGQELHHLLRVVAVPVHPDPEGLQPAQHQPGVERAGDRADRVLVEGDPLGELEVAYDEGAADDVGVATAVLRGGVHDDVGTEHQWLLEVRRGEGVVDDQQGAGVVRDRGQRLDVADVEQRVGRRLDPDRLRAAGHDRGAHGIDVADRRGAVLEPPAAGSTLSNSRWVPPYASSGITTWSPGSQIGPQQGVLGRQPGGEREAALPLLQRRDVALERGAGGVAGTAVLIAAAHAADAVLLVGGRGVDGRDHRRRSSRPARSRHGWRGSRSPP